MSKEQTPITAEELYDLMASLSHSGRLDDRISTRVAEEKILKWHNAKVLEALEKYRVYAWKKGLTISDLETFIETELKPKYEKSI